MPRSDSDGSKSLKNGITLTRNFEIRMVDSFKRAPGGRLADQKGYHVHDHMPDVHRERDRHYDVRVANARTASTGLSRELKGRHLQMIAIGGSIGTGLFVASGIALYQSGPASMILAYLFIGMVQFCIMQSLGELAVAFPVAGSFSAFSTRFLDPSWGFAMGWNYAFQWLSVLPLEIIAGALTIEYWNDRLSKAIFVTIFLVLIAVINLLGVKGYGEAEFVFSTVKVTAIVGFMQVFPPPQQLTPNSLNSLLGIVVNIGGTPQSGYIGGQYWVSPGPTSHGFKGFCSVLVTASLSFVGTELVGLAAAEAANPRKTLPGAIKQVFWRIAVFYIVGLFLSVGSTILPSVMNAVILLAVLSVGNSAVFGSSRVLAALAEQSHAPRIFGYVDRRGRPLVAIVFALSLGLLAYLVDIKVHAAIFDWLLSICGLSSLFTWTSICLSHIRFRQAWAAAGNTLNQLPYRSQAGVVGSWIAIVANVFVLAAQFWMAVSPVRASTTPMTASETTNNFFQKVLTVPVVILFYVGHKLWFKTRFITLLGMDIDTGRSFSRHQVMSVNSTDSSAQWPRWKKIYRSIC
ncbi:hypothetical protein LLEC1_04258 [Akanthomyces lecanii]|uniref:Amino acid permease/ SLC12A domain-containing protein n=1 Tax=Cordyceps confragosa TaxID=2714763 RepID=A0A179I7M9_CORDF|nr:hypothetical protein LLEC1_04258 [Akanthomyces lecanii]